MTGPQRKEKQLATLELMLTMIVAMNKMEAQKTRFSYRGSQEHQRHRAVIDMLCRRLKLEPAMVEDELQRLACRLWGEPTFTVPNREVSIGNDDDLWRSVTAAPTRIWRPPTVELRNIYPK